MLPRIEIQTTADGSSTLYRPDMDEHYHSTNGAVTEALHVYIQTGLYALPIQPISVLEIGFGTGLNAILTWLEAEKNKQHIRYTTVERFPLSNSITQQLNYQLPAEAATKFEQHADLTTQQWQETFDVIYFDAFAPDKQPEMWTEEIFKRIYQKTNPGGVLVTYCAKGVIRRMLQSVGFTTERLPGPPGKREMLRATKS